MSTDPVDPFAGDEQPKMRSGKITIAERPIEAGVYSWGWVDYSGYDSRSEPTEISVTMFTEPTNRRSMAQLRRIVSRPRWVSMLFSYGPVILGFFLVTSGNIAENGWLGQLALLLVAVSGWQIWRYSRALKELSGATAVWGDRNLENYIAGKGFLLALTHRDLPQGDIFAYFNLRAQVAELRTVLSDEFN